MATNEILRFAETDTGTNLLTQAEYLADSQRPIGNQPGVARSKLVNKALRQASLIAAGLAEYIADNQANNITDALTPQNIADYLQAALTGALGVTPPQFDNDTSLATTAFVQRALGNHSKIVGITSNTNISAADVGAILNCLTTGTLFLVLPPSASVPVGASYRIITNGSVASQYVLQAGGTDVLNVLGRAGSGDFQFGYGEDLLVSNLGGGNWAVIAGSGRLKYSASFNSSLAANGYQKLPSGLIIQWGVGATNGGTGATNQTLPIAFPNAALSLSITDEATGTTGVRTISGAFAGSIVSFQAWYAEPVAGAFYWIAIGY